MDSVNLTMNVFSEKPTYASLKKTDGIDRQADGAEILLNQAGEHIGTGTAHHVAKTRISLGKEGSFI